MKNQFVHTTEMKTFTANQWMLIDLATQFGNDKDTFEHRLAFGRELFEEIKFGSDMTHWIAEADEPALFTKGIIAVEDVLAGKPTGHVIGHDAAASGPQLLSVLTHCKTGMINTGALNTGETPDLYTTIYGEMPNDGSKSRTMVKKATVPYVYGSDAAPENVFGDDKELFTEAYQKTVPMAYLIRKILINAWNNDALAHDYDMPNGNHVHLECRGLVEYKGHYGDYTYTYLTSVNRPLIRGEDEGTKSLVANVTHSYDAFVVEELDQRCNYVSDKVEKQILAIESHLALGEHIQSGDHSCLELLHMEKCWKKFNFLSVAGLDYVKENNLYSVSEDYLKALLVKAKELLKYPSFETFSVHDEFKCSPVHMNHMRKVYNQILAETYLSTWLLDTIETLTGKRYTWDEPVDMEIYETLLNSEYAIG